MKTFKTVIASCLIALSAACVSTAIFKSVKQSEEANASIPSGYYDGVTDSMTGSTLQSKLKTIINTSSVSCSYDWDRFYTADEDPNNSSNILTIYARTSMPKSSKDPGSSGNYWNREHTFPQSSMSVTQAKSDTHIVYASDKTVNGLRGNKPMGVVSGGTLVKDSAGNDTTCRYTSSLFDPNNRARGQVARSTMYAAAMYDFDPTENFESIYTMLKWHLDYPVDSFDTNRNDKVYNLQHNRNPFVDHPDYACRIWGSTNSQTESLCNSGGSSSSSETTTSTTQGTTDTSQSGDYSLITSNGNLSNGDKVVIRTEDGSSGVTGWNNSKDATVASSGWMQYTVGSASSSGFTLKDSSTNTYIASPSANEFKYNSTAGTCSVDSEGHLMCNSRYLVKNSSYYRFYSSIGSYTPFYVYKVNSSSSTTVAVTSVSLNKESTSLTVGGTETLTATVLPNDATDKTVTWSSNSTGVATVSNSGVVTAVAAGTATITATSNSDSSKKATCTVTVTAATPTVTSVTLNKSTLSLAPGGSGTLTATVNGTNNPAQTVTWSSSNESVATVSNGTVTVKSTATAGQTCTITATSTVDTTKKGTCTLTVSSGGGSQTETVTDNITRATTGVSSGSGYTAWTGKTATSNAVYAGQSAGGNDSIQLRATSPSGIITTGSGGEFTKITITWNSNSYSGRTIDVYGKTSAYSSSSDLYDSSKQGTKIGSIVYGTSTELTSSAGYTYIGLRSNSGALYADEIEIDWEVDSSAASKTLSSISVSGQTTSFNVGDSFTFGGTVTANYSDSTSEDVTASASFSGYDMSTTGNQTVTVTYSTESTTYSITVSAITPSESNTYKLVSDVTKLRVGDKVIIVNSDSTYAMGSTQGNNNRPAGAVTENSDDTISVGNSIQSLEVQSGLTEGTYSFYTGSGYLYAASSSSNYLRTESTLTNNSSFTISISSNLATIVSSGSYTRNTINYNANNGNPIFSCYESPTVAVSIYKKLYSAAEYSKIFIEELSCDATGNTAPSQDNWSLVSYRYTNEVYSSAKTTLVNATPVEYKKPSTDAQYISEAMYLYDYVMVKYNKTSTVYAKFITGRASNGLIFSGAIYSNGNSNNLIAILIVIGIASATAAGLILTIRKRKEN